MEQVSVVVLNYNGADFLQQFLPDLIKYSKPHTVYVADNASTDNSIHLIENHFSEAKLLRFDKNLGFTGGYNQALKLIQSQYYILVNTDVQVTEHWIDPLLLFLEQNPKYAAVQPKIKSFHDQHKFEYAGAVGGFLDSLAFPYCRGRIFQELETDHGQYEENIDVDWVSGACMMIRADIFHKCDGFDLQFFAHMEEIDLCWRIRNQQYRLACIPASVVYHVGGGTLSKTSPFKTYLNFRNGLSMMLKNLPRVQLWKIPVRILLDIVAALVFMKNSGFSHFKAILKAHLHFYLQIPGILQKRKGLKMANVNKSKYVKSIVFSYYLLSRKKFNEL